MKKFKEFLIRLKPYKRRYRIFCVGAYILCSLVFLFLMLIFSCFVPNIHNGFYYFFNGFSSLFQNFGSEHKSCLGFVVAGFIIGYVPVICLIPYFYFLIANWLIYEKISEKFQNTSFYKYKKWATIIHFSDIAIVSLLITGIILLSSGYNVFKIMDVFSAMGTSFDGSFSRLVGIAAFIHVGVGYTFAIIVILWLLWLGLCWIGAKIKLFLNIIRDKIIEAKNKRLEAKLARKKAKVEKE